MTKFDPDYVVPTAEILKEWLENFGLTTRVACASRYERGEARCWAASVLDRILADEPLNDAMIQVVSAVTGVSEAFWRLRAQLPYGPCRWEEGSMRDDSERAHALADAAREYVAVRGGVGDAEVVSHARRWSMNGWQSVARVQGLDFVPTRSLMQAALALLEAR